MKRIVLVGAGHTHIELALRAGELVNAGYEVVLVNPKRSHPYSGMGPGLLSGVYSAANVYLPAAALIEKSGGTFVLDSITGLDPEQRLLYLEEGEPLSYDAVSFNLGSEPRGAGPTDERLFPVKPISSLGDARRAIEKRSTTHRTIRVAVIGGGPGGVELSANSSHLMHSLGVTGREVHLYTGDHPLAGVNPEREQYVEWALRTAGVNIYKGRRADPGDLDADFVFMAWGIRPPEVMENLGLPLAEDGGILIDEYLRSIERNNVFAVGDCATMSGAPLDRVGVFAVRMQPVLLENLRRAVEGGDPARELHRFTGTHKYLAGFNLGFGRGMLYRGKLTIKGRKAFALKDHIDRGFMKRYQQVVRKNG